MSEEDSRIYDHEHVFMEEAHGDSGVLYMTPCLTCGLPAMTYMESLAKELEIAQKMLNDITGGIDMPQPGEPIMNLLAEPHKRNEQFSWRTLFDLVRRKRESS